MKYKHRKVFEHVHTAILRGEYGPGDQVPTDGQLMEQFRTSRPTVARAMHDLEQAGLIVRRPGAGSFVRAQAVPQSKLLGLLIPGLGEAGIFTPITCEIARLAQAQHFHILWGDIAGDNPEVRLERAKQLCREFIRQHVCGVFFAPVEFTPTMDRFNCEIAESLDRAGIAVVLLDRDLEEYPKRSKFDLVGVDNCRIGYMQAEHVLGLGCRHIEYVAVPLSADTVDARIEGYRQAMRRHGVAMEERWIRRGDPTDPEFVAQITAALPEAFLCANDWTAGNLMRGLQKLRIAVPQDVRVVGVDDVDYALLLSPPLTTVRQPCREIGAAAVQAMLARLEDRTMPGRNILLDCRLVVRESCGSPAPAKSNHPLEVQNA